MVKIEEGLYYCEWCSEIIEHKKATGGKPKDVGRHIGYTTINKGHGRVSSTLKCPSCGNNVSQKKAEDIR